MKTTKFQSELMGFKSSLTEVLRLARQVDDKSQAVNELQATADADILMAILPTNDPREVDVMRARLWPTEENELAARLAQTEVKLAEAEAKLARGRSILYQDRDNTGVWGMLFDLWSDDPNDEPAAALAKKFDQVEHLRREVMDFAVLMEDQLCRHDDRPGWKDTAADVLLAHLGENYSLLLASVENGEPTANVSKKAANVANYSMMLTDIAGGLSKP
jgi:uncharacterized phage infection (PIP) family protein YhgE